MFHMPGTTRLSKVVRNSHFYWRYLANSKPYLQYQLSVRAKTPLVQEALIKSLMRNGSAVTTVRELYGDTVLFDELDTEVAELLKVKTAEIEETRMSGMQHGFKSYMIELLGSRPVLDPNSIFVRMAVEQKGLQIANRYFGMMTRLAAFNVWLNLPCTGTPRNSQLWHRDPEDRFILKMFIYLSDVDDESGPFFYAPGTHAYGCVRGEPESFGEEGTTARRSNDSQMQTVVPQEEWMKAIGSKGTIVFADTRGYHKGGLARGRDRLVYNCKFTSQASTRPEGFERREGLKRPMDEAVAFALGW